MSGRRLLYCPDCGRAGPTLLRMKFYDPREVLERRDGLPEPVPTKPAWLVNCPACGWDGVLQYQPFASGFLEGMTHKKAQG